jgi:hypothetical protein
MRKDENFKAESLAFIEKVKNINSYDEISSRRIRRVSRRMGTLRRLEH